MTEKCWFCNRVTPDSERDILLRALDMAIKSQAAAHAMRFAAEEGIGHRIPQQQERSMADDLATLLSVHGPMTAKAAADMLGKSESSIRALVSRYKDRFERMSDFRIVVLGPDDLPETERSDND